MSSHSEVPLSVARTDFRVRKYLGTDAVELTPDAEEVWLPVADHDVADIGFLQAVHYTGGH